MKLAGAVLLNGRCDAEWCSQSVVVERMPIESEMSICFRPLQHGSHVMKGWM